jgi:hypothetical protein
LSIKSVSTSGDTGNSNIDVDTRSSNIKYDTIIWCTGNNIEWYNATTGELKFNITPPLVYSGYLVFFLDDRILLNLEVANPYSSHSTAYPCINTEPERGVWHCKTHPNEDHIPGPACEYEYTVIEEAHYYISKGYPRWGDFNNYADEAREKNWKTIEHEYNLFIEQLKKEGRYRE